ncbi:CCA tRNA nucleotidyltransferase, mitochondrial [Triticum aestivum]|uniref:CCA tRNA nucleotidyltransferase, mitochondrial n=1 Tax=Triticum aestivum TaxID=4565 RepID=UPI001D01EAD8|nr:CCA tRNA nucleotidyltransferase, mitochondrial-like [Triticum aestivum]
MANRGATFFSCIRAFTGNSSMAAGSPEQLPRRVEVLETVELSEREKKIFQRLLDVVRHFKLGTELRVAGGWVRDKLLGKEPVDIDIALDNMTGKDFCEYVNKYAKVGQEEEEGIHIIPRNPDQSKHLETAKMKIFLKVIDFVNLRSEKYVGSSRIPTMKFGTAEEDAYRRDLTMNSLFFNINNNSVEDFTLRGIDDLKKGLIATPLPAKGTFLDDPLRVLRAIRFAARFNFTLSNELKEAASDENVKLGLGCKISRERIGKEINLMMSGKHPVEAMSLIRDLGLFDVVFSFPKTSDSPGFDNCDRCVLVLTYSYFVFQIQATVCTQVEQQQLYLYSALFFSLRKMSCLDEKYKEIPITSYIIKESLKRKACVAESVANIHAASREFAELVLLFESNVTLGALKEKLEDAYLDIPTDMLKRVKAGLILDEIKNLWRVALLISILSYPEAGDTLSQQDELRRRKEKYIKVERSITDLGLDGVWECEWKQKQLVNGNTIMGVLQVKSGGRLIGEWKERVFKWRLAHPEGTMDDCIDWLKRSQSKRQKVESSI